MSAAAKIVSRARLLALLEPRRSAGRTVALTNGVFDLIHVGHVRCLEAAKAMADVLVVAVNTDRSARLNKGPGRPVVPQDERAEIVAALSSTDYVVLFDEPDVRALIQALRPEIHAKGTDYTALTVPERAEVESYGGRVVITGDAKNHSSSDLAARLKGKGFT